MIKPLPPIAMSITETHSPPLPTDTGAVLAIFAAEAAILDVLLSVRELLRRKCDAEAGPSNRNATYEKATTKAHTAAWVRDRWGERDGMLPTTCASEMKMMAREIVAPKMMAMRRMMDTGGGVTDEDEKEADDDDDDAKGAEDESWVLVSRYAAGSQWSICTMSEPPSRSSWLMAVTWRRRRKDTPLSTAFSTTAMVNSYLEEKSECKVRGVIRWWCTG